MTTAQQDGQSGKPRQRSPKAERRKQKLEQQQSPKLDQRDEDRLDSIVAPADTAANDATTPAHVALIDQVVAADVPSTVATAPASNDPISIQTIANAYRDYTRKSFQDSGSFVEKLMGARSFDKAIEVQTEFVRHVQANFVAQSQKICELYGELAKQSFRPWSGFAAKFAAKPNQAGR
jgi:hypothetical protein